MKLTTPSDNKQLLIAAGIATFSATLIALFYMIGTSPESILLTPMPDAKQDQRQFNTPEKELESETENKYSSRKVVIDSEGDVAIVADIHKCNAPLNFKRNKTKIIEQINIPATMIATVKDQANQVTVELERRKVARFPSISTEADENGLVVVEIFVDESGVVSEANPNASGTTITNTQLRSRAAEIAKSILFEPSIKKSEQRGFVRIYFKTQ